jgi:uncharacterized protein
LQVLRASLPNKRLLTEVRFPELNHLFQTCKSGNPDEYASIEETIALAALQIIGDWIVKECKKKF